MTSKVFGIGWAKTGTTTLGECFERLGLSHVGGRLDLVDHLEQGNLAPVIEVARQYDSAEDWPWLLLYRQLDEAFPGSRFVLTTREPGAWLKSYRNMLAGEARSDTRDRRRATLYGFPVGAATDEQLVRTMLRHNDAVRSYFANRPADLLELDWSTGAGWAELCDFLGLPVPDERFPHANRGSYGWARSAMQRTLAAAKASVARLGRR
jgi:hypothetical protein